MQFAGIDNAFGADAFAPAGVITARTPYYKSMRLATTPRVRIPRAPKPPSQILKNFLLTYNG